MGETLSCCLSTLLYMSLMKATINPLQNEGLLSVMFFFNPQKNVSSFSHAFLVDVPNTKRPSSHRDARAWDETLDTGGPPMGWG